MSEFKPWTPHRMLQCGDELIATAKKADGGDNRRGLAAASNDWKIAAEIVHRLDRIVELLETQEERRADALKLWQETVTGEK